MRTHVYAEDPDSGPDHRGDYRCLCTLPKSNEAHNVPERTEDERELANRIVGES
jgi:hypothetical protein